MNDFSQQSQFDCLKLDAQLVSSQPYDDVIFLLSLYVHLEQQCDTATDRMEELAERITWRTEEALDQSETKQSACQGETLDEAIQAPLQAILDMRDRASLRLLDIKYRAEIAERYKIPFHIFGNTKFLNGGKDLELLELEMIELQIQNYMAQMTELEAEIAAALPKTPEGVMLKLHFLSGLCKEGSGFAVDVLAFVVDQSVEQLCSMLDMRVSLPNT